MSITLEQLKKGNTNNTPSKLATIIYEEIAKGINDLDNITPNDLTYPLKDRNSYL